MGEMNVQFRVVSYGSPHLLQPFFENINRGAVSTGAGSV